MLVGSLALVAALASSAHAHTRIFSAWVNGKDQGDGRTTYIRSPPTNDPVKDLTSPNLACNAAGGTAAPQFVSAAAGDTVQFEWYHNTRNDDIIDASHKGPIQVYMAPYTETNAASGIWTKIASDGYDSSSQKWAVDNLIANGGKHEFTIPASVAPGKYLIRGEIIALHEADANFQVNSLRGAQFYPDCVQFEITGTGSDTPPENFSFNTGYTEADPGIVFNLYSADPASYKAPGPDVWNGGSSGTAPTSPSASSSTPASSEVPAPTSGADAPTSSVAPSSVPTTFITAVATPTSQSAPVATAVTGEEDGDDTCDA